jgi:hypothetical protein
VLELAEEVGVRGQRHRRRVASLPCDLDDVRSLGKRSSGASSARGHRSKSRRGGRGRPVRRRAAFRRRSSIRAVGGKGSEEPRRPASPCLRRLQLPENEPARRGWAAHGWAQLSASASFALRPALARTETSTASRMWPSSSGWLSRRRPCPFRRRAARRLRRGGGSSRASRRARDSSGRRALVCGRHPVDQRYDHEVVFPRTRQGLGPMALR